MNPQMHSNDQSALFLRDKAAWDSAIAAYSGPDPLELWYNYICWYDYNMRIDPENKFREALEKCLTIFEHNEAYKQDIRMVKLWIKYLDTQANPLNLYQILYQRGVGTRCSCFYIGWAHYYDSANAFKQAESVYNLGFQAKAEPYDDLQEAHTKFRISLSHRMLYTDNSSKKRSVNHLIEQRQQITNLTPSKKARNEPAEDATGTTSCTESYVENDSSQQSHPVQPQPQPQVQTQEIPIQQNRVQVQEIPVQQNRVQVQEIPVQQNRTQVQEIPVQQNRTQVQEIPVQQNRTQVHHVQQPQYVHVQDVQLNQSRTQQVPQQVYAHVQQTQHAYIQNNAENRVYQVVQQKQESVQHYPQGQLNHNQSYAPAPQSQTTQNIATPQITQSTPQSQISQATNHIPTNQAIQKPQISHPIAQQTFEHKTLQQVHLKAPQQFVPHKITHVQQTALQANVQQTVQQMQVQQKISPTNTQQQIPKVHVQRQIAKPHIQVQSTPQQQIQQNVEPQIIQQKVNHQMQTPVQPSQISQQNHVQVQKVHINQQATVQVQSQTAHNSVRSYTHVESDQCNLKNSAYVISSSLNYIYNETQDDTNQMIEYPLENVKLPHNFVRFCKNNHESWKPLLYLEEPYDPNRKCVYRKDLVYPGSGIEFSPEEIRTRKWAKKLHELKLKQQQTQCQQQSFASSTTQVQKAPKIQHTQLQSSTNNTVYGRNIEEQIEASTIRFSSDTGSGTKNKTITIKFKRDKSAPNSNSFSSSICYGESNNTTIQQRSNPAEQKYKHVSESSNGPYDRNEDSYCSDSNDYVKTDVSYNEKVSASSVTPKVKKVKKVKILNKFEDSKAYSSYSVNNNTYNQSSNKKNYDDANLLLSFANTNSNEVRPTDNASVSTVTNETLAYNDDSLSNTDYNSTYSESPYPNRSNCSTPVRKLSQSYSSKTSTPLSRTLKRHTSNLSVQNDDSMCSYEQSSFFAAESNDDLKQRRLEKALKTIETHLAKEAIDPFNSELCKAFLTKIDFPSNDSSEPYKLINTPIPKLINLKVSSLADVNYSIEKEVGRGSYGSVYKATNLNTGLTVALKYQKPPNIWEIYICTEVRKRITNYDILPGFMDLSTAIIAPNASILVTEFSPFGSLLDINNKIRQSTKKVMHESLVMHFSSQILNIVSYLHSCNIVHADIKPDNFLLMKAPSSDSHVPSLRLIDFGCAIDMTLFPENTEFKKVIQTDGFTCTEMQEGRHWSYQTDYFCLAGTVHVMLFGEYMQIMKKFGAWEIKQKLPRYLKKHVWTDFFAKMLNIKSSDELPDLIEMKGILDNEVRRMDSELQSQIRALSNLIHRR